MFSIIVLFCDMLDAWLPFGPVHFVECPNIIERIRVLLTLGFQKLPKEFEAEVLLPHPGRQIVKSVRQIGGLLRFSCHPEGPHFKHCQIEHVTKLSPLLIIGEF
jgi:hypothetical protein